MSENLASQQLSIPNKQMGQMEPISNKLDSSIPNMTMGPVSNNPVSRQLSNKQMGLMEPKGNHLGSQQFLIPNKQMGEMEAMLNNSGSQQLSMLNKRRAPMEPMPENPVPQQLSIPNKRVAQMEPFSNTPGLQQLYAANKRTVQMQSMSNTPGSQHLAAPNKRMAQMESIFIPSKTHGPQQSLIPKNRNAQMEPSPKGHTESFESVRSKLRESLAASLASVSQPPDKSPDVGKNTHSEVAFPPRQTQESSQPAKSTSVTADAADRVSEKPMETLPSKEPCSAPKFDDGQRSSQEIFTNENKGDSTQIWKSNGQEFQSDHVLPDEDVSFSDNFLVKDELLQGNGLSWAMDLDMEVAETNEIQTAKKPKLVHEDVSGDGGEQAVQSPQTLAFKIEAELFKLFGGVNKKYKEKGRSLLFNLKDPNNPELKEKVMSGEISPERLCSMTAEELASKELSEWRIAKAEEFAQMVVLPDSDVDIRRLVKKTHKGEFQVEVEQDDSVSVEVSVGASSFTQIRSKLNETEAHPFSKPDGTKDEVNVTGKKSISEDQDPPCSITILPNDAADPMQGIMVDELKDVEFLPPIVSLDEFMESLDSEPPFENLQADAGKAGPISDKESSEVGTELMSSDIVSKDRVDIAPDKPDKVDINYTKSDAKVKSSESHLQAETSPPAGASKGEHVWEGALQLNISAMSTVIGFFRSGEKTSTNEWPSFLEIKGRVRLDAFEKFLQELPMSRSRALMVVHFVWKEGSPETEHASLCEVVDSYISDERVGFAEPAPGVELYFCPPHTRTLEMLSKHLPKDHTEKLNASDNGLIGVVVWRKAQLTSTISPNSSSHHKHSSKKQHYTTRRQQEKDTNMNANFTSEPPIPMGQPPGNPEPPLDDEDDIPPGFGPAAAREEDDLPEFSFLGGSNQSVPPFSFKNPSRGPGMAPFHPLSQTPSRPVEQMRQLIHKYGQTRTGAPSRNWQEKRGVGVAIQSWNDDDDDIPEWQPQAPQQQIPPPPPPAPPVHSFQQPMLPPHMVNQQHLGSGPPQQSPHQPLAMPLHPLQPPINVMQPPQNSASSWQQQPQQGPWWVPPSGPHGLPPSNVGCQPNEGQFYGAPPGLGGEQPGMGWRQDASRSGGF